jgi:hypothetical protein
MAAAFETIGAQPQDSYSDEDEVYCENCGEHCGGERSFPPCKMHTVYV